MGHGIVNIGGAPKHASRHLIGGADAITPGDIGAAALAHKARHATGGADALAPGDIGAAGLDADNKVLADQASPAIMYLSSGNVLPLNSAGKHVFVTGTSNTSITIPSHAVVPFSVGTVIEITDWAFGGRLSVLPGSNVSIFWTDGLSGARNSNNFGASCIAEYVGIGAENDSIWLLGGL